MQKSVLLNFEQNDQGGGKSASPHYAGRSEMSRIAARAQKECSFRWVSGWKALVRHTDAVEVCGIRTRSKLTSSLAIGTRVRERRRTDHDLTTRHPSKWADDKLTTGPLKVGSPFRGREIAFAWRTHEQTNEEKCSVRNFGIWILLHLAESAVAAVGSISAKLRVLWLQWEAFLKNWKCCGCSEKHFCKAESAVAAVESISEKLRVLWLQ